MPISLPDSALTTLEDVKQELGIDDDSEDARLARMIRRASGALGRLRRYGIHRQTITEHLRGYGGETISLTLRPIVSVIAVTVAGAAQELDDIEVVDHEAGIIRRPQGWPWTAGRARAIAHEQVAGTERFDISVEYVGGWATPTQVESDPEIDEPHLPEEIAEGAVDTVVALYRRAGRDSAIASESIASASVSYRGVNTAIGQGMGGIIPDHVWRGLNWLREIRV